MAAKIKEGLRDITQGVVERLKGGPKYADNLLGESLQDQLRKATAKELVVPSEELICQVIDTINQDIANGKDSKEIVGLLKKRLRTDNPHKQWLAVLLVGQVMKDCSGALGAHQEELLQEVARVMARPARQDSSAGKNTRQAAKDLLRSYGRAGTSAFRAVARSTVMEAAPTTRNPEQYADAINAAVARETAQVVEEVRALIEQAQANTELLSEMLLEGQAQAQAQGQQDGGAQAGQQGAAAAAAGPGGAVGGDEFENELTRELVTEVRELRALFDAYLEQLQSLSGEPGVEEVTMRALEAVDMLDGALSLQRDVLSNQRELGQQAAAGGAGGAGTGPNAAGLVDLISLDDLAEALLPQPPPVLGGNPSMAPPPPPTAAEAPAATPSVDATPGPADPFAALDPVAVQASLSPNVSQPQPTNSVASLPSSQQSYRNPFAQPQPQPYPSYPQQQQQQSYGAPAVASHGSAAVVTAGNPFAAPAVTTTPSAAVGLPTTASGNPFDAAASGGGGGNPFAEAVAAAAAAAPSGGGSNAAAMDSEWAMFFANRTSGSAQPPQPQQN